MRAQIFASLVYRNQGAWCCVEEGQSLAGGLDSVICLLREEEGAASIQLQLRSSQL